MLWEVYFITLLFFVLIIMAFIARDPNIFEIVEICLNEPSANRFAIENGLLVDVPEVGNLHNRPPCTFTQDCMGELYKASDRGRTHIVRCTKCKKRRSLKNGGELFSGHGYASWFARRDVLGRPNVKIGTHQTLMIVWCWANDVSIKVGSKMLRRFIGNNRVTFIDWYNYIRDMLVTKLQNAPPMGGPGQTVQIDESYFRGSAKHCINRRARPLMGNRVGPARRNYDNAVIGPWLFGMVLKHQDGRIESRFIQVPSRDAATLLPIIQRHIVPGSTIVSDQWAAYNTLNQLGYNHMTVNHSEYFVDPNTGAHTQLIECMWGVIKTKVIRCCRGTSRALLPGHLAEFWWRCLHRANPFCSILEEIRQAYPIA